MLGMLLTIRGVAIAAVASLVLGFASGAYVRDSFCDAATAKRDAADARAELAKKQTELKVAQDQTAATATTIEELKTQKAQADARIAELQARIDAAEKSGKPDPNAVTDARCRVTAPGVRWWTGRGR